MVERSQVGPYRLILTYLRSSNHGSFHAENIIKNLLHGVLEGLELLFVELPKFKPQSFHEKKMGVLWLRFLREVGETLVDVPEEFVQNKELSYALELAQESS